MGTTIFYFSASGNSLRIAQTLAAEMDSVALLPMAKGQPRDSAGGAGEAVGFVFPVYFNGLPRLVKIFIEELAISPGAYCFALASSGGTRSNTLSQLDGILVSKGLRLSYADEITVPSSYIIAHPLPGKERIEKLLARAMVKTKRTAASLSRREFKPAKPKARLWSSLVNTHFLYKNADQWDEQFRITEKCTGCGLCARVCPVKNITMERRSPIWNHKCEKCLACLNWCPSAAVEYGKSTAGRTRYRNPDITIEDMIRRIGHEEAEDFHHHL
ncbi:EFR1 family ferrodoxin [Breznakiella homolactica]|uniref:EFR1 family ferrodoxin n=1 Tax=Breznakiella homolactica TaxID=2798577 RepID=A0A7T7XK99_9SPIR|nr:EFR1 family ferrodoxin [Breznakiella homolactica]QQO07855.1 EFR1 family ferrodoxin [Breznakiella homolactica]